jgi:hypothetical protein
VLTPSLILLLLAAASGTALAYRFSSAHRQAWWPFGVGHAALGIAGLTALIVTLQGPPRGAAMGVAGFGAAAAVLFGVALALGLFIPLPRRGKGLVIAVHAGAAITGVSIFLAWYSLG